MKQAVMYGGVHSMDGAKAVLAEVSKLPEDHKLTKLILHNYEIILAGNSLLKLKQDTKKQKYTSMQAIV